MKEESKKPPIGLIPKTFHDTARLTEVIEAIKRYLDVCMEIDEEWLREYNELVKRLRNERRK